MDMEEKGGRYGNGFGEKDPLEGARPRRGGRRARSVRIAGDTYALASEAVRRERSRHHRVCDLGRRACGDCDYRDHCLQAQTRRALERHLKRDQQLVADESGQSTVEYALVFTALLVVVVGAGALMGVMGDGLFVQHAVMSASHCLSSSITGITDALCY